jgi:hypothetical protein
MPSIPHGITKALRIQSSRPSDIKDHNNSAQTCHLASGYIPSASQTRCAYFSPFVCIPQMAVSDPEEATLYDIDEDNESLRMLTTYRNRITNILARSLSDPRTRN